jgi:hypothetical protein
MSLNISYWVNSQDIICKVDERWDLTLEDPKALRVKSGVIIGRSMFDFICDDVTRMYLRTLLQSVRLIPRILQKPYRCDSPTEKRFMEMTLELESNSWVRISHKLIRTEPIATPILFKAVTTSKSVNQSSSYATYHVRCSICNHIRLSENENWQDVNELPPEKIIGIESLRVIYGVCANCMNGLKTARRNRNGTENDSLSN